MPESSPSQPEQLTPAGFRARLRLWGLVQIRPSGARHTLYQARDGELVRISGPEHLPLEGLSVFQTVNGFSASS